MFWRKLSSRSKQMSEGGLAVFEHPNFELRTAMQPTLLASAVQDAVTGMNKSISLQSTRSRSKWMIRSRKSACSPLSPASSAV